MCNEYGLQGDCKLVSFRSSPQKTNRRYLANHGVETPTLRRVANEPHRQLVSPLSCSLTFNYSNFFSLSLRKQVDALAMATQRGRPWARIISLTVLVLTFAITVDASTGDRLPEFKDCLKVRVTAAQSGQRLIHIYRSATPRIAHQTNRKLLSVRVL